MHDVDEFVRRCRAWVVWAGVRVDHVLANMVFDDFRYESVERAPAGSGLLQNVGAFLIGVDGALDGFDLTPQTLDAVTELGLFFRDVTHGQNAYWNNIGG